MATLAAPHPPADVRRITEADADFARLRDAAERRLSASVRALVRELRERPDVEHPAAQSAFIARHIALLRDAYAAGHAEGARDYYDTVSLQPAKWARALAPDIDERALRERLGFYTPSVAKLAHEARMAWQASQAQQAARRAEKAETLAEGQRQHGEYPSNGVAGRSGAYAGILPSVMLAAKDATAQQQDPLDAWFVGVQGRIGLQAEIAWPGLMDGYVRAGVMDPAAPFSLLWWLMEPGAKHCESCPRYAANGPYNPPGSGGNVLDATPGDGKTECGAGCKCSLSYVPAGGIEHTVWSVIAPELERQLAGTTGAAGADEAQAEADTSHEAPPLATPPQPRPFANYPFPRNPDGTARWPDVQPPKSNALADPEKAALDQYRAARERWERVRGTLPELPPMFADATGLPLEDAGALRALLPGTFETLTAEQQAALLDMWDALLAWHDAETAAGDVAGDPWANPGMFSEGELLAAAILRELGWTVVAPDAGMVFTGGHEPGYEQNRTKDGKFAPGDGPKEHEHEHAGSGGHAGGGTGTSGGTGQSGAGEGAGKADTPEARAARKRARQTEASRRSRYLRGLLKQAGMEPTVYSPVDAEAFFHGSGNAWEATHEDMDALFGPVRGTGHSGLPGVTIEEGHPGMRAHLERKVGRALSDGEVAALAGAHAPGSHVTLERGGAIIMRHGDYEHRSHLVLASEDDPHTRLLVYTRQAGTDHALPFDARSVAAQASVAHRLGIGKLSAKCDPQGGDSLRLPRLGFNAPIDAHFRAEMPGHQWPPHGGRTLLEVLASPEGAAWWRDMHTAMGHNLTLGLAFDTAPGSESMQTLGTYLREHPAE